MIRPYEASDKDAVLTIWRAASAHPFLSPDLTDQAEAMIRDVFLDIAETWIGEECGRPAGFAANHTARHFYRRYGFRAGRAQMNAFFGHREIRMILDPA